MGLGLGSVWVWVWGRLGFGHLVRFRVTGLAARWALVSVMVRVSLGVKVTDKVRVRIRVRIRVRVRVRVGVSSWLGTSAMIERTAPAMSSSSAPCTTWHSKPCGCSLCYIRLQPLCYIRLQPLLHTAQARRAPPGTRSPAHTRGGGCSKGVALQAQRIAPAQHARTGESAVRLGGAHRDCAHQQADPNPNPNP